MNKPDTSDIVQEIKSVSSHIDLFLSNELTDLFMSPIFSEMVDIKFEIDIMPS